VTGDAPWRATIDGVVIACRLTPKGGRDSVDGIATLSDGACVLLARVRAVPESGKANDALCALLAAKLGVATSKVTLTAGGKSRVKQIAVAGDPGELVAKLERLRAKDGDVSPSKL
jgi:uncharacterized protein YggU (UPF0235/DUF167 family)